MNNRPYVMGLCDIRDAQALVSRTAIREPKTSIGGEQSLRKDLSL